MIALKDVSAMETKQAAFITVSAVSVLLVDGKPQVLETTAPDFLCMEHDEAVHALRYGAATMTPDVWVTVAAALGVGA